MTGPTDFEEMYRAFEDRFRGSEELIRGRLSLYLPLIDAHPFAAGVLLARNVLLVGLFGWSLVALWRPDATLVSLRERLSRAATTATTGSIPVAIRG